MKIAMLVSENHLGIVRLVRPPALIVFEALPRHTQRKDEDERSNSTGWRKRGDKRNALEYGRDQEVDIGVSAELDDECDWEEGC